MRITESAEGHVKLAAARRKAAFDRIADPLWHAIARGQVAEVAHLMIKLQVLVNADQGRKQAS